MTDEPDARSATVVGQDALLLALIALLADQREADPNRTGRRKTEVVLADAGLTPAQIGPILGKRPDTVRVSITRARQELKTAAKVSSSTGKAAPSDG